MGSKLCFSIKVLAIASGLILSCSQAREEPPLPPSEFCGNGIVEGYEDCDGHDLAGQTCETLGFYDGTLECSEDCTFDLSACSGHCGDGILNGDEECDGEDIGGMSCEALGHEGGVLGCSPDCVFDTSECLGYCGDGMINAGEECDGDKLGGTTCEDLGFVGGELSCTDECRFDTSGCINCCKERCYCNGLCVDLSSSDAHCGQCGLRCFTGQSCVDGHCTGHVAISPSELKGSLEEKDFMLINVRVPPWGMIPGTDDNVSDEDLEALAATIGPDLHARVVVYCRTNPRSINAINQLSEMGYDGICFLRGGVEAWVEAGYPLE